MASSLFIDISACGVVDVWIESIQPGMCGQQGKVIPTRWMPDGNYHSSGWHSVHEGLGWCSMSTGFC